MTTLTAPQDASPRKEATKTVLTALAVVAFTLGMVLIASVRGWHNVTVSGTALLLGWVYLGFGVGEFVFARRFRVVAALLAVIFGIAGMIFSFVLIRWLGFK